MDDVKELSEIDRALADALDVELSPDFEARVRRRVAGEPMRAPFWRGWRFVVPVAAAAALVVLATLATRNVSAPQPLADRPLASGQRLPVAGDPVRAGRTDVPAPRTARSAPAVPMVARAQAEPEVLVPREEIEMYRRLIANAQNVSGAVLVDAPPDIVAVASISGIPIDPIKIELIIPPVSGEGDRQ